MARYTGPVGKVSRRLNLGITEKGQRILSKRPFPPGQHGPNAKRRKVSEYGVRLVEKQKARFMYGVLERQFRNTFDRARRMPGETGANLFSLLERRLDNVVYRMGMATTRAQARQLVNHGHVTVNGVKTDIPSFTVKVGEVIAVKEGSRKLTYFQNVSAAGGSGSQVPAWISPEPNDMAARIVSLPTREDAEQGIRTQLIVEHYSSR
jgi:small subunit ribosomal protein S4